MRVYKAVLQPFVLYVIYYMEASPEHTLDEKFFVKPMDQPTKRLMKIYYAVYQP